MSFLKMISQTKLKAAPMKVKLSMTFLFVLVLLFMRPLFAQRLDCIVAVVNNEVITQSEVDRLLATIEAEYRAAQLDPEKLKQILDEAKGNIINQMVEEKLVLSESKKKEIEVEQDVITARIAKIMNLFPNEAQFESALAEQGLRLKDLQDRFRDQEIMKKAVDYFVRSRIKVDPKELEQFYQAHQEQFFRPEKTKVKRIVVKINATSGSSGDEALEKAKTMLQRLKQGEEFAAVAKECAQGEGFVEEGDLGYIEKGQLIKEIDEAIFSLNCGEFSDVIKTASGYYIFKIEERVPKQLIAFAEAQDTIKEILYQSKFTQLFKEWINKLKQEAYIEIK